MKQLRQAKKPQEHGATTIIQGLGGAWLLDCRTHTTAREVS